MAVTLRWKLLPIVLLVALVVGLSVANELAASAPKPDAPDETDAPVDEGPRAVELTDLRRDPVGYLGERVSFVLQFKGRVESWNPGLSRFGTGDWVALEAWADDRFTWDLAAYDDPIQRLFVRRDGALDELMKVARTHERFLAVGTVREVFLGEPWIEIESLDPQYELIGEGTILHVGRARAFAKERKWALALQQYERALAAPLPPHAAEVLEAEVERVERLRDGDGK